MDRQVEISKDVGVLSIKAIRIDLDYDIKQLASHMENFVLELAHATKVNAGCVI